MSSRTYSKSLSSASRSSERLRNSGRTGWMRLSRSYFADGDLERAWIVRRIAGNARYERLQLNERLHGAFAVRGGIAHDQSASVILQRAGKDFRSRGTEPAGQHDQRPII